MLYRQEFFRHAPECTTLFKIGCRKNRASYQAAVFERGVIRLASFMPLTTGPAWVQGKLYNT
jgi:hypothetical protein